MFKRHFYAIFFLGIAFCYIKYSSFFKCLASYFGFVYIYLSVE
ncbi:hypothetical protein PLIP_a2451 [Pseudoalteromonas lipolytica LMEB 39]|nr:hypothetical protein [Pseudoalteromonas lipolytica LMEB 39]